MNKQDYAKLITETKNLLVEASPEQKKRIFEKLLKLKETLESKKTNVDVGPKDFLDEK